MPLEQGAKLGPFEILDTLGTGGMGEVYRAQDTRLDRVVAIKVLPAHLSASPELKQRLEREAKVISSLSHPHICTLFDVGHDEDTTYLVMEHLEGETLAARLEKGSLPMEQVLAFGIQIADALDRAHKSGVVHRDMKPGNVMLTASGVKLLDFGLAKQHASDSSTSGADLSQMLTQSPDSANLTAAGTILGTFQYMAPEQIEGGEVDARSDIFALGAVLYEMATGHKAFSGKSQASLIGSIMQSQPEPVSRVTALSPPAFDRVIEACLAKDPEERWHTAHDVRLQLQWIAEGGSQIGLPAPVATRRRNRERLAWATATIAAIVAATFAGLWAGRAPEPPAVVRFDVPAPKGLPVVGSPRISPDGRLLAFDATDEQGRRQIWLRPLNSIDAQPLAGTDGVTARPFWSPDSRHVGFMADGKLKRIPVTGGPPQVICDAPTGADGTWSEDGIILFDGRRADPILQVPAGGGIAKPRLEGPDDARSATVGWPQFLPGGKSFLYVRDGSQPEVMFASADGDEGRRVLTGQSRVEYAPPGYLLFVRESTLVAQPFDANSGELTGDPMPMAQDLGVDSLGLAHFSASRSGVLVFRGGEAGGGVYQLVDRNGQPDAGPLMDLADIAAFDLSPDGRWLAFERRGSEGADIWIRDLTRGTNSRFTFADGNDGTPVWSPDGTRIAFATARGGASRLAVKAVGGAGEVQLLLDGEGGPQFPTSWSSDGRHILFAEVNPETNVDTGVVDLEGGTEPRRFLNSKFVEMRARFSPDARWIAYQSNESGRAEIYVRPFEGQGRRWQISTAGGTEPQWNPRGGELFYLSPELGLMRVGVNVAEEFEAGIPERLFTANLRPMRSLTRYVVSRDGQGFLLLSSLREDSIPPTTVVLNWTQELAER